MAQPEEDVSQDKRNKKTKQTTMNRFFTPSADSGSTTSSESHPGPSGTGLNTSMNIKRENESPSDTESPSKKPKLSQNGGSDRYEGDRNHVEDAAVQSAENTSPGKSKKVKVKEERLPFVSFTQINMDKFKDVSSDMDKIIDKIFKSSDCEEKYERGDEDHTDPKTHIFQQQGFCCISESKATPFSKLGFHHKKTNDHYIIFYHRINEDNRAEMFAATTGQAWRVAQKFADYDFPRKIANRILSKKGSYKRSEMPLFGGKRKVSTLFGRASHPDKLKPYYIKSSSAKLRKNASIFKLKCFTHTELSVKRRCQIIRIEHRFRLEDIQLVVDHLSQISRGQATKTFEDGKETDIKEEDCPESQSNNLVNVDMSDKIELDNKLHKLLFEWLTNEEVMSTWVLRNQDEKNHIDNFYLYYKHPEDFTEGYCFELRFKEKTDVTLIKYWDKCPDLVSVITAIRDSVEYKNIREIDKFVEKFPKWFSKLRFTFKNKYGQQSPNQNMLQFMFGDLMKNEKLYWHMNNQWFQFTDDYLYLLNSEFKNLLEKSLIKKGSNEYLWKLYTKIIPPEESLAYKQVQEEKKKKKKKKREEEEEGTKEKRNKYESYYNNMYKGVCNFIVGDTETLYHIELFDLLFYDEVNDQIFLYHVKEGFEQKTRDACSQIKNSVEMLSNLLHGRVSSDHKNKLEKLYNEFVTKCQGEKLKTGKQMPKICDNFAEFKKTLRNAHFVYAFPDTTKETRSFLMEMEKKNQICKQDLQDKLSELDLDDNDKTRDCLRRGLGCGNSWAEVTDAIISNLQKCGYADPQSQNITAKLIHLTKGKTRFTSDSMKWLEGDTVSSKKCKTAALHAVFGQLFELYITSYDTLIGKFELNRVREIVVDNGFEFKICEIEVDEATKNLKRE